MQQSNPAKRAVDNKQTILGQMAWLLLMHLGQMNAIISSETGGGAHLGK